MSRIESKPDSIMESFWGFLPVVTCCGVLAVAGASIPQSRQARLSVVPRTGLTSGQKIRVSGADFAKEATGGIVECNDASGQPTIKVYGNKVRVSCTNPLNELFSTNKNGSFAPLIFKVHEHKVGPPAEGTDSAGHSASADAAKYPCPPTPAQVRAGDVCIINAGDAKGDNVTVPITFKNKTFF
jgi:hypothetical protein